MGFLAVATTRETRPKSHNVPCSAAVMAYELVGVKKEEDGVVIVSLKNPPVNALSTKLMTELEAVISEISKDRTQRAVILTGDGQYFCAGADLKEIASKAADFLTEAPKIVETGQRVYRSFEHMPQPVIAAINGLAIGGGLEMALSCDIRVCGETAKVGLPEVTLGLIPAYGGTQRLARTVGPSKAREMIFTGGLISGKEAERIGLVNKVVPSGQELRAARDIAHTIAAKAAPLAISAAKKSLLQGYDMDIDQGLKGEAKAFLEVVGSQDLMEGIAAQLERRPPKFAGK